LKRSLEETAAEFEDEPVQKAQAIPENLKHVTTKRGRKNTLYSLHSSKAYIFTDIFRQKEKEQFKLVMGHSLYRSNPLGVLQEHLSNTVKLQQKDAANSI